MRIRGDIVIFFILLIFPVVSYSSGKKDKINGRISADIGADLGKNLSVSLEVEQRATLDVLRVDEYLLEPGLDYSLSKAFRIGGNYRLSMERDLENGREWGQRAQVYIRYETEYDDFELKVKSSLQYGLDEFNSSLLDVRNELVNRNYVRLDYNWFGTKLTPNIRYEIFYHINNLNGGILYKWRTKMGCSYRLQKNIDIDFFYFYDREFNIEDPENTHVFGIGLSYKL